MLPLDGGAGRIARVPSIGPAACDSPSPHQNTKATTSFEIVAFSAAV